MKVEIESIVCNWANEVPHILVRVINAITLSTNKEELGISDKKRPKMGLFCSYMTKRDLKHLVSLYLQGE